MQSDHIHPVAYALTIARAVYELANDAVSCGSLPKPMAAAMSGAANSGAIRLDQFLASQGANLADACAQDIRNSVVDLEAMAQIAGLVVTQELTEKNATYLAMAVRYTADQAARRLKHIEEAIDR